MPGRPPRRELRSEVAFGHLNRQRGAVCMAAGTGQFKASVFGFDGVDFRKIKHLVSQRPGQFCRFIGI